MQVTASVTSPMQLAVMGNPIGHSRSPLIHQAFAKALGLAVNYVRLEVPLDAFASGVADFFDGGGSGANVTLPFKQQAFALCQELSTRAQVAGAVNTLWRNHGVLCGDNTDGFGLVRDMRINQGWQLAGRRLLILGAGGAVRGILQPLYAAGVTDISVANRTLARAQTLAADMRQHGINIKPLALADIGGEYDLVINAISAGLTGDMPALPNTLLNNASCCYDLVYGKTLTPFTRWAQYQGCREVADGLGMLVEQAAASFEGWTGQRPATIEVIEELRNAT